MLIKKKKNTRKISNIIKLKKTLFNPAASKSLIATTLNLLYHSEQSFFWQPFPMKKDKGGMSIVLVLIAASPHAKQGTTSQHTTMGLDLGSHWALKASPLRTPHIDVQTQEGSCVIPPHHSKRTGSGNTLVDFNTL